MYLIWDPDPSWVLGLGSGSESVANFKQCVNFNNIKDVRTCTCTDCKWMNIHVCIRVSKVASSYCSMSFVPQSALGWDERTELSKHESQTDAAKGFGGKYGVQSDRVDKVSVG